MTQWVKFDSMKGEGVSSEELMIMRRRGDKLYNVYKDGKMIAIGFVSVAEAVSYVERRQEDDQQHCS